MKAHPDKGGTEAKMAAVNEAYEVLSNPGSFPYFYIFSPIYTIPELRQRFDNGDDPNDPMAQQGGGGGNPFAHFFHGGSGGGQQFHFNHGGQFH